MDEFGPELGDIVLAACKVGAKQAGDAFGRCLEKDIELVAHEGFETLSDGALPESLAAPGLVIRLEVGDAIALVLVPAKGGLTADWLATPDETGHERLKTLGNELGQALLPEDYAPSETTAVYARDIASIGNALQLDQNACYVRFSTATEAEEESTEDALWLVWPAKGWSGEKLASPQTASPESKPLKKLEFQDLEDGIRQLPSYARNLLKIPMSATVTLASTKMQVAHIEELGPGSIIQFQKSCEDFLSLEVGGCEIAEGEAVKVGEKFGFWITSILMPSERFEAVKRS